MGSGAVPAEQLRLVPTNPWHHGAALSWILVAGVIALIGFASACFLVITAYAPWPWVPTWVDPLVAGAGAMGGLVFCGAAGVQALVGSGVLPLLECTLVDGGVSVRGWTGGLASLPRRVALAPGPWELRIGVRAFSAVNDRQGLQFVRGTSASVRLESVFHLDDPQLQQLRSWLQQHGVDVRIVDTERLWA